MVIDWIHIEKTKQYNNVRIRTQYLRQEKIQGLKNVKEHNEKELGMTWNDIILAHKTFEKKI